jgi:membrane-associated protein
MSLAQHLDVASPASYALALFFPALDAVLPLVPSESLVITLGVATAGSLDPRIAVLVALAAVGAWLGDNLCYLLGRRFGPFVERHVFSGERGTRRREWARSTLERRGAALIVACRFIPGGRTAVTVTCGATHYPRRPFVAATAVAGALWATYAFALGRIGGRAFEDRPWAGLLLALGVAAAATALIEIGRRLLVRHAASPRRSSEGVAGSEGAPGSRPGS